MRAPRPGRALALVLLVVLATTAGAAPAAARVRFEKQVVSLDVTYQDWDEDRPWAKNNPATRTAAAVVVEGPYLLTRAQIVSNATLIQAEGRGDAQPWSARVAHIDPEIDLALIALDDPAFFDGLEPVKLAKRVPTEGSVSSVRWSDRQLEVGNSRVSTIDVRANRYGNIEHLFLEVRSDLENGGWAEPVFDGSKLVGITASQEKLRASIVPAEILRAYLERAQRSFEGEPYRGFSRFDLLWQNNQDRALTRYLGFEGEPRGVLIRGTRRGGSACGALKPRDILLELDGKPIDAIGNTLHPHYGNIRFTQLAVEGRSPGDAVRAMVFRDGSEQAVEFTLRDYQSTLRLVPWRRDNAAPPYLIAGGIVFRELDGPYLRTWGNDWGASAPMNLVIRYHLGARAQTPDSRRVILLSSVLPDRYNLGYHDLASMIVDSVNGHQIDSVRDLAEAFQSPERDAEGNPTYHVITLAPNNFLAEIVLDARDFETANQRILKAYGIPQAVRFSEEVVPELGPPCETTD